MIVKWIVILLLINLIWFLPLFEQWNLYQTINDKVFSKVKIKGKMSFFFKAIGGQSVSTHGVIKSLLFLQVKGYALSICSMILMIILWFRTKDDMFCLFIMGIVWLFSLALDVIVIIILSIISKIRSNSK